MSAMEVASRSTVLIASNWVRGSRSIRRSSVWFASGSALTTAQRHDDIRGIPGTFERTLRAAKKAREVGLPFQVNTLQANKQPIASVIPEEGATGWADTTMLAANAKHPNCAYKWMQYITTPKPSSSALISSGVSGGRVALRPADVAEHLEHLGCAIDDVVAIGLDAQFGAAQGSYKKSEHECSTSCETNQQSNHDPDVHKVNDKRCPD